MRNAAAPSVRAILLVTATLLAGLQPLAAGTACGRVVAVGDLHGGYDEFVTILREVGLVDAGLRWRGGDTCLVQLGDVLDRGPRSREILELLMRLEREAPGRVHVVLGNHEAMTLLGDLRFAEPGEFRAFAADESPRERRRGFEEFLRTRAAEGLDEASARAAFEREFPPGWFARRRALSPRGEVGRWLLSKPVVLVLGDTLFVHGGLTAGDAAAGVDALNRRLAREIREYDRLRGQLARIGLLSPLAPFGSAFGLVEERLRTLGPEGRNLLDTGTVDAARRFLALRDAIFLRTDGPLWNRDLALADEATLAPELERVLTGLGVRRVVAAHTRQDDARVGTRLGGQVFLIDTGAGPYYGGRVSALEIAADRVRAIYPGEAVVLSGGEAKDAHHARGPVPAGRPTAAAGAR